MSVIKRYSYDRWDRTHDEDPDGKWVEYSDIAKIELDLTDEILELRGCLKDASDLMNNIKDESPLACDHDDCEKLTNRINELLKETT